jgi:hypothetical protein
LVLCHVEGKISHKQFRIHDDYRPTARFFHRSRPPGFKSTLNRVQLKIYRFWNELAI